tara:strand:- start:45 stop:560 length:516 start_codon:yes stop_codon:yes gene_type:complete
MALKYYLYRKDPSCIIDQDDEVIPTKQHPDGVTGDDPNFIVIRQDLDPAVPLTSWKLNAAGNAFEDIHAGKSDEERIALNLAESEVIQFAQMKEDKRGQIKAEAKAFLEEINWKVERAKETDLLNGNNAAMTAVANEKQAIRDANNAKEVALDAITTNDCATLIEFNPKSF